MVFGRSKNNYQENRTVEGSNDAQQNISLPDSMFIPEQQQIPPQFDPLFNSPMYQKKADAEFTKWQLDVTEMLELMEHNFRGEVYDQAEDKWEKRYPAEMSEEGIAYVMKRLRFYMDRNFMLTNLKDEEVFMISRTVSMDIAMVFYQNYRRFGIDKSILTTLVNQISWAVFVTLKRAWGAEERKSLRENSQRQEIRSYAPDQEKKGLFSKVMGR